MNKKKKEGEGKKKENVHAKHKKSLAERFWKQKNLFILLIPSLVWVILICYAPMTGLYMSFINYTPQGSGYFADMANSQFVGLDWFKYFFSTDFTKIMRNTLATSLLTLLFSFPLPIILALCLNEVRNQKAKKFVQTASYIPYFISWVIAANIFLTFLSSDGVINNLLKFLGLTDESILFFQKGPYFWWIIAIANAWKVLGYNAIIYMAAISGISHDMYEAADVDGASEMLNFFKLLLPVSMPVVAVLALWQFVAMWNSYFDAMIYLNSASKQPLQLVLRSILIQSPPESGMIADIQRTAERAKMAELLKYATIIISSLPLLVMYPFFQKYFDAGIMAGSIKG